MIDWKREVEIVGFNGQPLVECGRALPIALRKSDRAHCVIDLSGGVDRLQWHSDGEADELLSEHRWTKLRTPLFVPSACQEKEGAFSVQPMIAYTNQTLLDNADRPLHPDTWKGEYLIWKKLNNQSDEYQATCGTDTTIASLMNHWADGLLKRFDAMAQLGRDNEYLVRIADFALCAATNRNKRWEAFLRYSIAQQPDKVQRTYDTMIRHEFPGVTWETFIENRLRLTDAIRSGLQIQTVQRGPVATVISSNVATASPKVHGIAAVQPIPTEQFIKP